MSHFIDLIQSVTDLGGASHPAPTGSRFLLVLHTNGGESLTSTVTLTLTLIVVND